MPCHELEGQGKAIDECAEPVGGGLIPRCHGKAGVYQAGAIREQCHRVVGRKGAHRDERLIEDAKPLAAGDKHTDPRTGCEQSSHLRSDLGEAPLAPVEHHEPGRVAEALDQAVGRVERSRRGRDHI